MLKKSEQQIRKDEREKVLKECKNKVGSARAMYQRGREEVIKEVKELLPEEDKNNTIYPSELRALEDGWNNYREEIKKRLKKIK